MILAISSTIQEPEWPFSKDILNPEYGLTKEFKLVRDHRLKPATVFPKSNWRNNSTYIAQREYLAESPKKHLGLTIIRDEDQARDFRFDAASGTIQRKPWTTMDCGSRVSYTDTFIAPDFATSAETIVTAQSGYIVKVQMTAFLNRARTKDEVISDRLMLEGITYSTHAKLYPFTDEGRDASFRDSAYTELKKIKLPESITMNFDSFTGILSFASGKNLLRYPIGTTRASYKEAPDRPSITAYLDKKDNLFVSNDLLNSVIDRIGQ